MATAILNAGPPEGRDWEPEDVVYQLHRNGHSLRQLAIKNQLNSHSLSEALRKPWLRGEQIIADALGLTPEAIWPDRHARRLRKGQA